MSVPFRPENPYVPPAQKVGVVTSGPLRPVGLPDDPDTRKTLADLVASHNLYTDLELARQPETAARLQPDIQKATAPGTLTTALNLATGNMIAPFSDRAAEAATEHDLDAYAKGGGNPSAHANLFGAAAALGAVAGNTALAGTGRATAATLRSVEAPVAKTALGRIGQSALSGAATNAAIGGASEAAFGDEHGQRNLGDVLTTAAEQGVVGGALGAGLGAVTEGVGALAKRFRPENPFVAPAATEAVVPGRVLAERNKATPVADVAKDVAKEEAPNAVQQDAPDAPTFRAENPYARAGAVNPSLLVRGGSAAIGGATGAAYGASQGDTPEEKAQLALEYGALGAGAGLGVGTLASSPEARGALRSGYRQLMVTPYAKIEEQYPELTDALNKAGASTQTAQHIAMRRTGWVTEGLSDDQQRAFSNVLLRDTNLAKADAAASRGDTQAEARFRQMAADHDAQVPQGTEQQQWFTDALDKHRTFIGDPLENAAQRAGVSSVLPVASSYLRGVSRDRLDNIEIRRAMDARAITDPSKLQPRGPVARALIGERPDVARLERTSGGIPQGPLNPALPTQPTGAPPRSPGATRTGSAKAAQGTAREYVNDYQTLVQRDAEDKIVRGATNDVYAALDKAGFQRLGPKDDPPLGMQALTRTVPDANGNPVQERWAVPKAVKDAVSHFEQKKGVTDASGLWRKVTGAATRMQIAGMPVEATSHMNTLASIVASVPGEKDVAGKAMSAIPGVGAKAAAIREMAGIDFRDPAMRQLETRLADIGALRIEPHQGGLINTSHNALFGPEGVDVRGRLVLARKYLAKAPNATDAELREFITSKLGNYSRANSGALVNGLQDSGLSAFARFQAARIPSSVRSTFGASGLPTHGMRDALGAWAQTAYRGPLGYAVAGELANYAMTGHRMEDNERGHQLDVQLPFTVGANNDPTYLPLAFTNPVLATGARVSGARDLLPFPGAPNLGGKIADAQRDVVNTGLGVLSPLARAASVGATGRTPYVLSDGSMLRVTDNRFDKGRQAADNLKASVSLANPAMAAFAEQGGDLGGHRLSDALTEDGKRFGGPKAIGAKAAEFLFPRVLTLGVGGRDNALSAVSRDQREYQDAMRDYTAALRRAPGPFAQEEIIRQAVKDAEADGRFAPDVVEKDLRAVLEKDGGKAQDRRERSLLKWEDTHAQ